MFESDFIRLRLKCMLCVFNTSDSESMKQHFDEHEARVNHELHYLAFTIKNCIEHNTSLKMPCLYLTFVNPTKVVTASHFVS